MKPEGIDPSITFYTPAMSHFMGFPINTSDLLIIQDGEDWSDVRSKGRAARCRAQGHRQRIKPAYKPDPKVYFMGHYAVMHPATFERMKKAIDKPKP